MKLQCNIECSDKIHYSVLFYKSWFGKFHRSFSKMRFLETIFSNITLELISNKNGWFLIRRSMYLFIWKISFAFASDTDRRSAWYITTLAQCPKFKPLGNGESNSVLEKHTFAIREVITSWITNDNEGDTFKGFLESIYAQTSKHEAL